MGPRSRSFQRLTSHLIAFHYPRHRNLIQFGCCWCLENGWIRFRPMRTKPPGHCPQTLIEVHWRLCQYMCNKLWYESGLLPSVVSCRSLQQVSHLTVSLPERYISFARIILFFSDRGGCSPPAPYADELVPTLGFILIAKWGEYVFQELSTKITATFFGSLNSLKKIQKAFVLTCKRWFFYQRMELCVKLGDKILHWWRLKQ